VPAGTGLVLAGAGVVAALAAWQFRPQFRRYEQGLADLLPYAALVRPGVVVNKDGSLLAGFEYRGPDMDSATAEELGALSSLVSHALLGLGNGWMIQAEATRRRSGEYPEDGAFPDPVTRLIDAERRVQYGGGQNYETSYALYFTYLPPPEYHARALGWLVEGVAEESVDWEEVVGSFEARLRDIADVLGSRLELTRLSGVGLLSRLHGAITGLQHKIAVPPTPCYLDVVLASEDLIGGMAPKIGNRHISVLGLSGFPLATVPGLLDELNRLPCECRIAMRFLPLDEDVAKAHIARYRRNWWQMRQGLGALLKQAVAPGEGDASTFKNQFAVEMASDADEALAEASSGLLRYGYYTPTIVVIEEDRQAGEAVARLILKTVRGQGFGARQETINAVEAYLSSLPGVGFANVRRPLINSANYADLAPFTSVWPGLAENPSPMFPPHSPALLWAASSGATPFRLNLHADSDVGHTLVLGPTGAGKSALVALLEAQWFRYPGAQCFVFDKGYSSWPLVAAAGGHHYDIAAEDEGEGGIAFYPLGGIDAEGERAWAAQWLETLLALQNIRVSPTQRALIARGIAHLAEGPTRTLTELRPQLQDNELRMALTPYVLGGSFGYLLDAEQDGLREGRFQVFEMSHLMQMGKPIVVPVLLYLFHQIERRLDGRPTLIVLEEAWTYLDDPLFSAWIQRALKEFRKRNAAVVFVTQSLGDVAQSSLRHVIYESCPTRLFLPNAEAGSEQGADYYRAIGLNARQIEMIAGMIPKREYLYVSPRGRRRINLTLGPVALAFLGAGSAEQLRAIRALREQVGAGWPVDWLRRRGLHAWADSLAGELGGAV